MKLIMVLAIMLLLLLIELKYERASFSLFIVLNEFPAAKMG
jgi:hypothetical protein